MAGRRIAGWAFADSLVQIEAAIGDKVIASVAPDRERPDVGDSYPRRPNARLSGFALDLPEDAVPADGVARVRLTARPASALHRPLLLAELSIAGRRAAERIADAPATHVVGPFPREIIAAVAALWPEAVDGLDDTEGQRRFVQKLAILLATPELRSIDAIARYGRYLRACWAHCGYVDRYFPISNAGARPGAPDFHCKPNSVAEIFAIVHQLYVLRSYGLEGEFAEFGCFKGFSSAMLSFACRQLGLKMHIFDSFEGLPAVEGSNYAAGEYAGALEEVTENVRRYGAIEVVEFHKGFFADTFRSYRPPPLMALWMDVDLEVSARDLMVVADRLDPRATLFSHECEPAMFAGGEIRTSANPDNPIPPVVERFEQLGRPLTGRFIRGNTGSFWPRAGGIPVLDNAVLHELVKHV